ncbi:MAG: fasciclin domain-containing protein [Bacteroidaceae bacterium]|nr:fasciclin domain-containing protein [Bacteroidaceae bacterium]
MRQLKITFVSALAVMLCMACTEEIDMSNRYTFTEETVISYLEKNEQFTEYVALLNVVHISNYSESTVAQLLSARGNFTCFAPNNNAIQQYLDTLYRKNIIDSPTWEGFRNQEDLDSIRKVIVYNSIIDGGDVKYFETSSFPTKDAEFEFANMNDRKLTANRPDKTNSNVIVINKEDTVSLQNRDIEAINGRIHEMLNVIAPSNDRISDFLQKWIDDGGSDYIVTAKLIMACGLSGTLDKTRDETWEELYQSGKVEDIGNFDDSNPNSGIAPEHRKYGFTIFAETDAVWLAELQKEGYDVTTVDDITIEMIREYVVKKQLYSTAKNDDNYSSTDNVLNQFVTYHILPARISADKLIVHYNELGYNYALATQQPTIATEEFYTTMGKPRLLKVFESAESQGIYLNRFPVLRNGRGIYSVENLDKNDYHEDGTFLELKGNHLYADENEGIRVETGVTGDASGVVNTVNGIIYPIGKILAFTDNVQTQLQSQRIRFDMASMLPEMMTNDVRRPLVSYPTGHAQYRGFPTSYQYFDNVEIMEGTRFYYLNGLARNWFNWQGDEFNIIGRYEFTLKLPPVPKAGHYELRLAVQSNSHLRGMCQVYWGPDKNNLPAIGIPLDMRMGGQYRHLSSGVNQASIVGWEADTGDSEYDDEVDKRMRNNGFMKGPQHYSDVPGSTTAIRTKADAIRRIMVSADMDPNTTYYLKFKSVLDDEKKQFYIDYIEYCAKEVYDNPKESEDIW